MADILPPLGDEGTQASDMLSIDGCTPSAPRKIAAPIPNPEFSFPLTPLDPSAQRLTELLPSPVQTGSNRPRPNNISLGPTQPSWTFNPPSPTKFSTASDSGHTSPNRSGARHNHKRGGSEFIGGDGSETGPGLQSTSPKKGDGALSAIPASGRRRGHAHRRSGAISHHDLSAILKPNHSEPLPTRPGSLPTTPTTIHPPALGHAASQPSLHSAQTDRTPPATPKASDNPQPSLPPTTSRPRVGFSDTVEFIPRPLSTISSETSSSMSTVRASHSVTGSITSIISNGTPSPSSARKSQYTADILERYRQDVNHAPTGPDSPTPSFSRRRSSPPPASFIKSGPDKTSPPAIAQSPLATSQAEDSTLLKQSPLLKGFEAHSKADQDLVLPSPPYSVVTAVQEFPKGPILSDIERPRSSPEAKALKKQRKVKTWAESILSRRARGRLPDDLGISKTSTPRENFASFDEFSVDDVNFDDDNSYVIKSPDYVPPTSAGSATSSVWPHSDDEADEPSHVLDLDATWEQLDLDSESKSPAAGKKRMYSGAGSSASAAMGYNFHRRTESAPALTPVTTSILKRPVSNPQMADVFEEDEDELTKVTSIRANPTSSAKPTLADPPATSVVAQPMLEQPKPALPPPQDISVVVADVEVAPELPGLQTPHDIPDFLDEVEIVDTVDEPRFSVITKSSDESTVTPTLHTPNVFPEGPIPTPSPPKFALTPLASTTDVSRLTFDALPPKTEASSITDRSTFSLNRQECGGPSTLSYSTEDVPSLTSSASTTFSSYQVPPQSSPTTVTSTLGERSFSFSGVTPRHARPMSAVKRASLASLSRLVGSSHGERSKLSLEVYSNADTEEMEKKKRNRISRLMKFWKPKGSNKSEK